MDLLYFIDYDKTISSISYLSFGIFDRQFTQNSTEID